LWTLGLGGGPDPENKRENNLEEKGGPLRHTRQARHRDCARETEQLRPAIQRLVLSNGY
jgi:hypothetical protein